MGAVTAILCFVVLALALRAFSKRGELQAMPPRTTGAGGDPASEDPVERLLLAGRKIDAIKVYRAAHRVGLAEAKQAVEEVAQSMRLEGRLR